MKTLVCYKTKGGATEKYAKWMAEDLHAELKKFEEVDRQFDFSEYDDIVVSSGTYAGLMPLTRFLKRKWKDLEGKEVYAVAVGAAPADDPWSAFSYKRIPEKIREKINYFKLMGETPEKGRPKDYVSPVKKENLKEVLNKIKS